MSFYDKLVPDGYEVEETDERFDTSLSSMRYFSKRAAEIYAKNFPPKSPSYRWEVERRGWFNYEVVPYLNRLKKIDP